MKQLFFILFIFSISFSYGQNLGVVSGKILDAELYNEPLLMARVEIKNTDWVTQTNFNGNFELVDIKPGDYILKISFLGYDDVELPIAIDQNNNTYITQSLKARTMGIIDVAESVSKEKE